MVRTILAGTASGIEGILSNRLDCIFSDPTVLHMCSVTSRLARGRLIRRSDPSFHVLRSLIASASSGHSAGARPFRQGYGTMHSASFIIEWLGASSYIKQQRNIWAASKSFVKVLAKHKGVPVDELIGTLRPPNGEVLRYARVKLDCVQNLCFREIFKSMPDNMDIFLYIDSSPQVRGQELFACSFEAFDGNDADGQWWFSRRYMPLVSLGRDYLDAPGKCLALLWIIFLMVGPSWQQVRRYCNMVRIILTGMGTERLIHSMKDMLSDFFELMLDKQNDIPRQARLFPNCLCIPGWQHGWDTVLRRGLSSLRFFPTFIAGMRALVNFMRAPLQVDVRHIVSEGYPIVAAMIESCKGKVPSIAEWRWGALLAAMETLGTILSTLRSHFAEKLYSNAADPSKIKAARAALTSTSFGWQFKFVLWFARWLCHIAAWGKGSSRKLGDGSADPDWNGRRLPHCWEALQWSAGG